MRKGSSPTLRFLTLLLTLTLSAAGASCDGDDPTPSAPTPAPAPAPAPAPSTVSLSGTVVDAAGGISGVTITVLDGPNAGRMAVTNATGAYLLDALTRGNGNVSATHVFYNEERAGAAMDGTSSLNFTMQRRTVGLTGTVENSAGGVVTNATVRVVDGPSAGAVAGTDVNGVYRFTLLAGNANLFATAPGFNEDRRGVVVNGTNTLNFRITQTTPTVSFTATRVSGGGGAVPQEWAFVATVAGSLSVRNYDWNFGDGASASETGSTEQHVYRVRGTYTVTLTVNLTNGSTLTASKEISTETSDPEN